MILLDCQHIDMLAINKTRLDESISDQDVKVVGEDVIRCDRIRWGYMLQYSFEHLLPSP